MRVPLRRLASSKWRRVAVSASAIFRVAFRAALLVGSCVPCHALDVDIRPLGELTLIEVSGDLEKGDDNLFAARTSNVTRAVVTFRSDGGSLLAGIGIGELIRSKGFSTLVPANARCASACALAWLGGTRRYMSPDARLGVHAAYNRTSGSETGVGNALLGAYVNKLGLSYLAVVYITQASPTSMTWLSAEDAKKNEIDVTLVEPASSTSGDRGKEGELATSEAAIREKASEFVSTLFTLWSSSNEKVAAVQQELQDQIMRYRIMERDVTDPLALGLLQDIVAELEAALQAPNE